jgi:hypothetical protein
MINAYRYLVGSPEGERPFGKITVKSVLKKQGFRFDSSGLSYNPVAGSCEDGNEPSSSTKRCKILHQLSDYQIVQEDCAAWK